MDRRVGVVVVVGMLVVVFFVLRGTDSGQPDAVDTTRLPLIQSTTTSEPPNPTVTLDLLEAASVEAAQTVLDYWEAVTAGDGEAVALMLDMEPAAATREVGIAEYGAAFGGVYNASCEGTISVGEEWVVDCVVVVEGDPMVAAFELDPNPTQFRVRDGRITRVGHLSPYRVVDLALSSYARDLDEAAFRAACNDPEATFAADGGVVYNGTCGEYLASLVIDYLASRD